MYRKRCEESKSVVIFQISSLVTEIFGFEYKKKKSFLFVIHTFYDNFGNLKSSRKFQVLIVNFVGYVEVY